MSIHKSMFTILSCLIFHALGGDEIAVRFTRAVQEPGAPVRIEGVEEIALLAGDGTE